MVEKSKGQTEVAGFDGGILPAVEGHSLGTRYIIGTRQTEFISENLR